MPRVQLAPSVADLDAAAPFSSELFDTGPAKVRPGCGDFATCGDLHVATP
jgi:hypothetical protein